MGCPTPESLKGCRTLHSQPTFSGTSSSTDEAGSCGSLSPDSVSSGGGAPVHPSEILCTHVHGLQVAVTVGLEGDPLGRKGLGLPIPPPAAVVLMEVVGTVEVIISIEVSTVVPPVAVIGTSSEGPINITQSCPFPGAKKCLADARASSWLSSLIHWTLLEISVCLAICPSGVLSDITFTEVYGVPSALSGRVVGG